MGTYHGSQIHVDRSKFRVNMKQARTNLSLYDLFITSVVVLAYVRMRMMRFVTHRRFWTPQTPYLDAVTAQMTRFVTLRRILTTHALKRSYNDKFVLACFILTRNFERSTCIWLPWYVPIPAHFVIKASLENTISNDT